MTRTPRSQASLVRRLAVGVAATAATLTVTLAGPATVSAETESTSSATIASSANHAEWLLVKWQRSGLAADYSEFAAARGVVARETAAELDVSAGLLEAAWAMSPVQNQHVVLSAMSQLGVPYRSRASKENVGFDCSGLALYAYGKAGVALPRSSGQQIKAGTAIDEAQAIPGDLVYYPGHMSIYVGAGLIVHSPQSGKTVEVRPMFERRLRFGDATPDAG